MTDSHSPDDDELVRLRTFPGRLYAEMIAEALKREAINCIIKGEDTGILGAGTMTESSPGTITLWVRKRDLGRAEQIANQMLDHI